jgi:hypothetical protein
MSPKTGFARNTETLPAQRAIELACGAKRVAAGPLIGSHRDGLPTLNRPPQVPAPKNAQMRASISHGPAKQCL